MPGTISCRTCWLDSGRCWCRDVGAFENAAVYGSLQVTFESAEHFELISWLGYERRFISVDNSLLLWPRVF